MLRHDSQYNYSHDTTACGNNSPYLLSFWDQGVAADGHHAEDESYNNERNEDLPGFNGKVWTEETPHLKYDLRHDVYR